MRPETVTGALLAAARQPEHGGLRFLDGHEAATWFDWTTLVTRALGVAQRLAAWGVAPGDRIGLVFPTGVAFFDALFGVWLAGAVPVPLYPPLRLGRLDEYYRQTGAMLAAAGARLLLADDRVRRLLGSALAAAAHRGQRVVALTLDELPPGDGTLRQTLPADPAALALVQFSSGTTVEPKPVALSHRAVQAQSALIEGAFPESPTQPHAGVCWLPLYHDMGLIGCILPALNVPGELTLFGPELFVARPARWLRAISRYRATISPAPNFAYAMSVDRVRDEELEGVDLTSWRLALNGAEPVAPGVLRAFNARFAAFGLRPEALTPVYGLSEAALAVTFSDVGRPFVSRRFSRAALEVGLAEPDLLGGIELVSVGRTLPGIRIEIRDPQGTPVPERRIGRVWTTGPSLMDGYLGRPEETARVLCDGWLDTGDLGFLDRDDLYLTGRAKDMLLLRGRNHPPQAVEQAVDGLSGVRAGCVAAASYLPEGASGEILVLLVEHSRSVTAAERETLAGRCREAVLAATGLRCDEVALLSPGTLPRTSSGKIRRGEALRRWRLGELSPPRSTGPLQLLAAMARSSVDEWRSK